MADQSIFDTYANTSKKQAGNGILSRCQLHVRVSKRSSSGERAYLVTYDGQKLPILIVCL